VGPLAVSDTSTPPITLRRAVADDVPAVVALLADDQLGATREGQPADAAALAPYRAAFAAIDADPAHLLVVAVSEDAPRARPGDAVVGTLQLSFLPGSPGGRRCGPRSRRCGSARGSAVAASGSP
jgi:hypothetical protein